MTPEEIPKELVALLDDAAGKPHSAQGPVLAALAKILTAYTAQIHHQTGGSGMRYTDDDVARLATHITGHPDAAPDERHLAATRALLAGLAGEGLPALVAGLFGGGAAEGHAWYRSLAPDGSLWCETSSPDEAAQSVDGLAGYTLQKLPTFTVRTPWQPWQPTPDVKAEETR